ncbi:NAD(P)/FAD-dependent oxidoreductase [Tepidibacter formicigenes]|jgi:glycerol-3-phosphate dehydrogenase|uniref:Glycerol-3-phosphate dehydrogenase n=1 Tax=Tepidibacter formicigenes DSM 15518 TaxID=1123349 RepID=A0A1M6PRP7_9FIRM|nr:NAD(P)/FAD-dependent oxidoreductase [Tepidibacter formicigenes]SHK10623.1 glycerol-3-phosphate dehydrogenase [Tepidibacter formicigenes DSM 15518]
MFDVAIIGAGVVGASIARELSKYKLNSVVLEKGVEVCQGTTKANSAIVHGGYDALEGTLKAKLNVQGNKMYEKLCNELDVHFKKIGSLVLAFNYEEVKTLEELYERGITNGVDGLKILNKEEVKEIEPNVSDEVVSALYCSSAGIVCPFNLTVALMENAIINGVQLETQSEVLDINKEEDYFNIETKKGNIKAKYVINAAGVYADKINNMIGGDEYYIIPRKGEYRVLDRSEGSIVKHVLFQCPTKKGKGVLVTPTVHGNVLLGPTANEVEDREDISITYDGLEFVTKFAKKTMPDINTYKTITSFAGVRATPNTKEFMIFASNKAKGFINVGGIESPGLTAAPAIAKYVIGILKEEGLKLDEKEDFNPYRKKDKPFVHMTKEERKEAIAKDSRHSKIICRCETTTEAEIIDAIHRPAGARTVDGVKRRVRPGMGRCQGGFCGPRVVEILARELNIDMQEVLKDYENSKMILGKVKESRGEKVEI